MENSLTEQFIKTREEFIKLYQMMSEKSNQMEKDNVYYPDIRQFNNSLFAIEVELRNNFSYIKTHQENIDENHTTYYVACKIGDKY